MELRGTGRTGEQLDERANARLAALDRSQAVVEFDLDGHVVGANANFLALMEYAVGEITGRHHRIFCAQGDSSSAEYTEFWAKLRRGEYHSGEYRRVTRSGQVIWLRATYNPVMNAEGQPIGVVKFAVDVTESKRQQADYQARSEAINRSQAIIELALDGTILDANENFFAVMGYRLDEIAGRHHQMFCTPKDAGSPEYSGFWRKLGEGRFDSGLTSGSRVTVARSGCKPPTTRSSIRTVVP